MPHVAPSALEVSLKGAGGRRRGKAGGDTSVPKTSRKGGTGLLDSEPEFSAQGYQREGRLARTNTPMTVTSPPGPRRRRHLKQYQRRALTLLAGCGSAGCHEEVMRAHGFRADELATMVRIGFVAKTTERVAGGVGQTFEVERFKITEEGERALG